MTSTFIGKSPVRDEIKPVTINYDVPDGTFWTSKCELFCRYEVPDGTKNNFSILEWDDWL